MSFLKIRVKLRFLAGGSCLLFPTFPPLGAGREHAPVSSRDPKSQSTGTIANESFLIVVLAVKYRVLVNSILYYRSAGKIGGCLCLFWPLSLFLYGQPNETNSFLPAAENILGRLFFLTSSCLNVRGLLLVG